MQSDTEASNAAVWVFSLSSNWCTLSIFGQQSVALLQDLTAKGSKINTFTGHVYNKSNYENKCTHPVHKQLRNISSTTWNRTRHVSLIQNVKSSLNYQASQEYNENKANALKEGCKPWWTEQRKSRLDRWIPGETLRNYTPNIVLLLQKMHKQWGSLARNSS